MQYNLAVLQKSLQFYKSFYLMTNFLVQVSSEQAGSQCCMVLYTEKCQNIACSLVWLQLAKFVLQYYQTAAGSRMHAGVNCRIEAILTRLWMNPRVWV